MFPTEVSPLIVMGLTGAPKQIVWLPETTPPFTSVITTVATVEASEQAFELAVTVVILR